MSDEDETCGFTINKDYAEKYNSWRQKEEFQRLKSKYGDVELEESDDSNTSEDEDEDAIALTPQMEKDWFKTLAALKSKDPRIYDKNAKFYHSDDSESESGEEVEKKPKTKERPIFIKDYERKVILEKGGVVEESEDDEEKEMQTYEPGYYEEQDAIKLSINEVTAEIDSDSDDEFLTRRKKTKEEQEKEEGEYLQWLKGQKDNIAHDSQVQQDLAPLKQIWSDPNLSEGEKFLRDYILNKRYKEEDDDDRIPTYEEIVDEEDISEDEKLVERQEFFERKYNFRFEEPDQEFIKSYPRTVGDSLRRKDDRRVKKRQEVKERKEKDKTKKREELKQLKNLKRREIIAKIDQLRQITGNKDIGISEGDIEDDFDPKKYDNMMKKAFDNDYYDDDDAEKPVFPHDEEIDNEKWDEWAGEDAEAGNSEGPVAGPSGSQNQDDYYEPHCEDPDFNMDADYDPNEIHSHGLRERNKKKKKSKFKQALEKKKPVFDPSEKTFEEYFDEYYKLDYEDMIDDLPCRFKYRQVPANDYGLSVDEILTCNDKELNAWVSLKKMSQHKTDEEEHYEKRLFMKKARNQQKKLNILTSLGEEIGEDEGDEPSQEQQEEASGPSKKGKGKGKGKRKKNQEAGTGSESVTQPNKEQSTEGPSPKRMRTEGEISSVTNGKKKLKQPVQGGAVGPSNVTKSDMESLPEQMETKEVPLTARKDMVRKKKKKQKVGTMSDERLKAFGINPKKFKYTHLPKIKEQRKAKEGPKMKT